jgi:UDP-glucuronate 4-epimerase
MDFITAIENALGKEIEKNMMPLQAGDVPSTYANVEDLVENLDYQPNTPVQEGIDKFVTWYREFFKV